MFAYKHELYEELIAIAQLELIKIGIAHLDVTLPESFTIEELKQAIALFNSRLTEVENKLSSINPAAPIARSTLLTVKEKPREYN
jgi:hypothetical protein